MNLNSASYSLETVLGKRNMIQSKHN